MKKLISTILILAMLLPAAALSDLPDISGLSFDELVQLREQINLAIWNSEEWQEVTVPIGVWKVGEDIPAGEWTLRSAGKGKYGSSYVVYCDRIKESGLEGDLLNSRIYQSVIILGDDNEDDDEPRSVNITISKGMYLIIDDGPVIFTPYTGKPDLGFK